MTTVQTSEATNVTKVTKVTNLANLLDATNDALSTDGFSSFASLFLLEEWTSIRRIVAARSAFLLQQTALLAECWEREGSIKALDRVIGEVGQRLKDLDEAVSAVEAMALMVGCGLDGTNNYVRKRWVNDEARSKHSWTEYKSDEAGESGEGGESGAEAAFEPVAEAAAGGLPGDPVAVRAGEIATADDDDRVFEVLRVRPREAEEDLAPEPQKLARLLSDLDVASAKKTQAVPKPKIPYSAEEDSVIRRDGDKVTHGRRGPAFFRPTAAELNKDFFSHNKGTRKGNGVRIRYRALKAAEHTNQRTLAVRAQSAYVDVESRLTAEAAARTSSAVVFTATASDDRSDRSEAPERPDYVARVKAGVERRKAATLAMLADASASVIGPGMQQVMDGDFEQESLYVLMESKARAGAARSDELKHIIDLHNSGVVDPEETVQRFHRLATSVSVAPAAPPAALPNVGAMSGSGRSRSSERLRSSLLRSASLGRTSRPTSNVTWDEMNM